MHLHDPDPICSRGLSVEDRARINKDKITAFPGAAAQDEAGPRIRNFHPSVLQGTWCHPAGRECFRALLSLQPQAPSANVLLAKAQLPMPSAASHPQAGPDSRPVRQPSPPAPFNTNPAAIRSLSCHCTAADCVSGTWDEGTPPPPHTFLSHAACARWGGAARHARPGKGLREERGHLNPPHREDGALHSLPSGVGVPPRRWRPRRWGWARRRAGARRSCGGSEHRGTRWRRRPLAGTFQGLVHPPDATVKLQHPQRRHFPAPGAALPAASPSAARPFRRSFVPTCRPPGRPPSSPAPAAPCTAPERRLNLALLIAH